MSDNAQALAVRDTEWIPEPLDLSDLCADLFWSMARADQRRWAEVYLRGLISVPGRKSIRRIADHVVGYRAEQSLQQFLNQSPWDERVVRQNLATVLSAALRPRAWVFREVAFPKHGQNSVAVARQYAPSLGRVINGQLGIAAFLACDEGSCPVTWRLSMPQCWDEDTKRRTGANVPPGERSQPWWHYVLDAIDEMASGWGMPAPPVLVDGRHEHRLEPLLRGLEARRVRYAVQVAAEAPIRATGGPRGRAGQAPLTLGGIAASVPPASRTVVGWSGGRRPRGGCSAFALTPLAPGQHVARIVPGYGHLSPRHLLAEWPLGQPRPSSLWITNLSRARLPNVVGLLKLSGQVEVDLHRLSEECGLQHFEGRSFRGWHHHVTLVSAAYAYRLLRDLEGAAESGGYPGLRPAASGKERAG
jgi:hypothetical protein